MFSALWRPPGRGATTPLSATRMRRAGRRWVTTGSTGAIWRRPARCETLHGFHRLHGMVEGGAKPPRSEIAGPALGLPWPASGGTSRARTRARFITGWKIQQFLYYVKRNLLVFRRRHGALAGKANRGPLGALGAVPVKHRVRRLVTLYVNTIHHRSFFYEDRGGRIRLNDGGGGRNLVKFQGWCGEIVRERETRLMP